MLESAERAYERRSTERASWLASSGLILVRTATAIERQRAAEERIASARNDAAELEEDLARFRSMRREAEQEIERLEAMGSADGASQSPGVLNSYRR